MRFSIDDNYNLNNLSNYTTLNAVKIAHSGTRYFILSRMALAEIIWPHSPLTPQTAAIYDIPPCQNITSLSANQQLIVIQTKSAVFIYERGVTRYNQILAKFPEGVEIMLHPEEPWFVMYSDGVLKTYSYQSGYLRINNIVEPMFLTLNAVSHDSTDMMCSVDITLENITDVFEVYETIQKQPTEYLVASK